MKHRLRGLFIRQNPRPLELKIALPAKSTLMQIQKSPCLQASKEWQSVLYGWSREEMNKTWSKTRRQIARLSNCVLIQTALMSHLSSENASSHSWLKKSAVWWKNRDLDTKCHKLEALDWKKNLCRCGAWDWDVLKSASYAWAARLWARWSPILPGSLPQYGGNSCVHMNRLLGILIQGSRYSGYYQNMNRASTLLMFLWLPTIQKALAPATHFSRYFILSYSFNPQFKILLKSLLLLKTQYY